MLCGHRSRNVIEQDLQECNLSTSESVGIVAASTTCAQRCIAPTVYTAIVMGVQQVTSVRRLMNASESDANLKALRLPYDVRILAIGDMFRIKRFSKADREALAVRCIAARAEREVQNVYVYVHDSAINIRVRNLLPTHSLDNQGEVRK
jgi:hypothetical protein